MLWIHIPRGFRAIDIKVTSGRFSAWVARLAHILWNDRHPIVMVRETEFIFVLIYAKWRSSLHLLLIIHVMAWEPGSYVGLQYRKILGTDKSLDLLFSSAFCFGMSIHTVCLAINEHRPKNDCLRTGSLTIHIPLRCGN